MIETEKKFKEGAVRVLIQCIIREVESEKNKVTHLRYSNLL